MVLGLRTYGSLVFGLGSLVIGFLLSTSHVIVLYAARLCLKSENLTWTGSVPPRGSGWVNDQVYETLANRALLRFTHPLPRGGTDPVQLRP